MRIWTCNVRSGNQEADGENHWTKRRSFCIELIRSNGVDIVCGQEVLRDRFLDLRARLPEYDWIGQIDEPGGRHPVNTIFYRRDAFERVSSGGYWLSETPHVAGSTSWDSSCIRLANWVWLVERSSGVEFRVVNTHLDHVSQPARENQARILAEDAAAYPDDSAQFLTGDLNADMTNEAIRCLKSAGWRDTYEAVHGPAEPGNTYHGFLGPAKESELGKIDWIFARGTVTVADAAIIRDNRDGRDEIMVARVSAVIELGQ